MDAAPTIVEELAVVAQSAHEEFQAVLMAVCLAVLSALVAVAVAMFVWKHIKQVVARIPRQGIVGTALSAPLVVAMLVYGGSKHFDSGISNNGTWWDSTNSVLYLSFNYQAVLSLDVLHVDARPVGSTNAADWVSYWHGPITTPQPVSIEMPDATNLSIWVWSEYVEPEHVVTNGVFHMNGVMRKIDPGNTNEFFVTFPLRLGDENKGFPTEPDPRQPVLMMGAAPDDD